MVKKKITEIAIWLAQLIKQCIQLIMIIKNQLWLYFNKFLLHDLWKTCSCSAFIIFANIFSYHLSIVTTLCKKLKVYGKQWYYSGMKNSSKVYIFLSVTYNICYLILCSASFIQTNFLCLKFSYFYLNVNKVRSSTHKNIRISTSVINYLGLH